VKDNEVMVGGERGEKWRRNLPLEVFPPLPESARLGKEGGHSRETTRDELSGSHQPAKGGKRRY